MSEFPSKVSLMEGLGVVSVRELDVIGRWQHSDSAKSLAVPLGVKEDGGTFCLNIADSSLRNPGIGPHGMIAGTHGSGKSETLRTLLLSLAVNFSPNDVNFVLFEAEGSISENLEGLPHTVGVIRSNWDDWKRGIEILQGEVKRRQGIFSEIKDSYTQDLPAYMKYRKAHPERSLEHLPHLIVVMEDYQKFMDSSSGSSSDVYLLMRAGRSVGVHVILSVETPEGVIKDTLMSNLKFCICMRTASPADSTAVIGTEDAFSLTVPGRAYFTRSHSGKRDLVQLQVFCSSSPFVPEVQPQPQNLQPQPKKPTLMDRLRSLSGMGKPETPPEPPADASEPEHETGQPEIALIVQEIIRTAETHNFPPSRPLFAELLPKKPPCISFLEGFGVHRVSDLDIIGRWQKSNAMKSLAVPIGVKEDGEPFYFLNKDYSFLDTAHHYIIAGTHGSGKTELLKTILLSIAVNFSPENVNFALFESERSSLSSVIEPLPHTVSAIHGGLSELKQFIGSVRGEMIRRQGIFSQVKDTLFSNITEYTKYRKDHPELNLEPLPYLIVVMDNFAEVTGKCPDIVSYVSDIMADRCLGMHVILSIHSPAQDLIDKRTGSYFRAESFLDLRICMRTDTPGGSKDVIGTEDAFKLSAPGSAYFTFRRDFDSYYAPEKAQMFYSSAPCKSSQYDTEHPENTLIVQEIILTAKRYNFSRARQLSSEPLPKIPRYISFLEGLGADGVSDLDVIGRWQHSDPVKSLAVPLGVDENGETFFFNIADSALRNPGIGPHGMIAGIAGSGKTELLRTYLLSMALHFSPEDVNFVLIDIREHSLSAALQTLPHAAGIVTNQGGPSVFIRALKGIEGEVRRRQRIFAKIKDLPEHNLRTYMKYRRIHPELNLEPIPHLVVVIDEFAEFMCCFPDFYDDISSIMRIGRSMGIHVILSMQSPQGAIKGQIAVNLSFRIGMRTATKSDSKEVIGTEDAFRLPNPGRAVIKGRTDKLVQVQTFYSGAPCKSASYETKPSEGDLIVQEIIRTAKAHNVQPACPVWLEPLPEILQLDRLIAGHEAYDRKAKNWTQKNSGLAVTAGLADDPANQSQYPFVLDFVKDGHQIIFGEPSSGKTTFLQTVLTSAALTYTPEQVNFVILDYGSNVLNMFESLPHTVIAPAKDDAELKKAGDFLLTELETRRRQFGAEGVTTLEAYREASGMPVPAIVVVVDNIAALNDQNPEMIDTLSRIARDGGNLGIYLMISALNYSGAYMYKIADNVKSKHTLQMIEKTDYRSITGSEIGASPGKFKGRGFAQGGLEYQAALCIEGSTEAERSRKLKALCAEMSGAWTGKRASLEQQEQEETPIQPGELTSTVNAVQIGMKKGTREPVEFVFRSMNGCVITGTNGGGKSSILGMIAQALDKDPNTALYVYEEKIYLEKLCPNARIMHTPEDADKVLQELADEFDKRRYDEKGRIVLCIDDFYTFYQDITQESADALEIIAERGAIKGIYIYVSCSARGVSILNTAETPLFRKLLAKGNAVITGGRLRDYTALRAVDYSDDMTFSEHEGVLIHSSRVIPLRFGLPQGVSPSQESSNPQKNSTPQDSTATHDFRMPSSRDMMTAAVRLDTYMAIQQVIIDDVEKTINDFLSGWQGDARDAFKESFEKKIKEYRNCRQDFVKFSEFLRDYSQTMGLIDDDVLSITRTARPASKPADTHTPKAPPSARPDPLPETLHLQSLTAGHQAYSPKSKSWQQKNSPLAVTVGLVSNPEKGTLPFVLDFAKDGHQLLYGAPSSGKTAFLQTVILSAALSYTPEQAKFVILDYGNLGLKMFEALPQCVIAAGRTEANKLMEAGTFLNDELIRRSKVFSAEGVTNIKAYREATGIQIPEIIVVIDNIASLFGDNPYVIKHTLFRSNWIRLMDVLIQAAATGGPLGIYLMITADSSAGASTITASAPVKKIHTLQMTNPHDYKVLTGAPAGVSPGNFKGRGLTQGGLEFQTALYIDGDNEADRTAKLKALCSDMSKAWTEKHPPIINGIRLGIKKRTLEPAEFVLWDMNGCIISGVPGSGKSNILALIAKNLSRTKNTRLYVYEEKTFIGKLCPDAVRMHNHKEADDVIDKLCEEFLQRDYDPEDRIILCIDDLLNFYTIISESSANILEAIARSGKDKAMYIYAACSTVELENFRLVNVPLFRELLRHGSAIVTGGSLKDYRAFSSFHQSADMTFAEHEGAVIHAGKITPVVFSRP